MTSLSAFTRLYEIVAEVEIEEIGEEQFNTEDGSPPPGGATTIEESVALWRYWPVKMKVTRYFKTDDDNLDGFVVPDRYEASSGASGGSRFGAVGAQGIVFARRIKSQDMTAPDAFLFRRARDIALAGTSGSTEYIPVLVDRWIAFAGAEAVDSMGQTVTSKEEAIQVIEAASP